MASSLISEFSPLIGRPGPALTSAVERGAVARFAEALGAPILLGADGEPQVPPTFLASLPYERPPLPRGGDRHLINAKNMFTFVRTPRVGEAVTTTACLTRVSEVGSIIRLGLEVRYSDSRGAPVASVDASFIVDYEGVCADGLGGACGAGAPHPAEPPFVPHGVARRKDTSALRAWADAELECRRIGDALPPLTKAPLTVLQFVQYAGASGDFNPLHYDRHFATRAGFPDVIAPGLLKMAFFAQHLMLCAGSRGELSRLEARYIGIDVPGRELTSRGIIRSVEAAGGRRTLDIELALEDQQGQASTLGSATLKLLPSAP